ncbi:MAG: hypothetical protein M3N30_09600 [Bacteroidota bacterium]|nr:hypothetical protein [Bacteroidota bacterium]
MKRDLTRNDKLDMLRIISLVVVTAASLASFIFTIRAGHRNKSVILILLFAIWVLSPFVTMAVAGVASVCWSNINRVRLYILMTLMSLISLAAYSGVLIPYGAKPAFVFLIGPLLSWVILTIIFLLVRFRKGR